MEWVATLVVGVVGALCSLASAVIVANKTSEKLLHKLEIGQAVQNEKVEAYQRQTNEKIGELIKTNKEQQEWGTRIAILENDMRQLKKGDLK